MAGNTMTLRRDRDIVARWRGNPIVTLDDLSFRCNIIRNAGAVKVGNEYLLLLTIQCLKGVCRIYAAHSKDGYYFEVNDQPLMAPSAEKEYAIYEEQGVLDARVVCLDGDYYICYDALGPHGYRLGLARTRDFQTIERLGLISEPDTKCGVLFPRKIGGKYARLERPGAGHSIWVSYSDDLEYWGWGEAVMTPRGGYWDNDRIGVATPPVETEQGWLFVYYGVKQTSAGPVIRLGAAMLEAENPSEVIGRTNVPILSPRERYERIGEVPNLVYSCGAIVEPDEEVKLYYGAANSCICLGLTSIQEMAAACLEPVQEF
ncbi:MAG: glycoside hydrolase family 130 protein [Anaerolineae bacterium]